MLRISLAVFLIGLYSQSAHADFASAQKLFEQQDYNASVPQLELMAKSGHAQAQYMLAQAYANGWAKPVDVYQAYAWTLIARESGSAEAGTLYSELRQKLPSRRDAKNTFASLDKEYGKVALQSNLLPSNKYANSNPVFTVAKRLAQPEYPSSFKRTGIPAWAIVFYDINEAGRVENAHVALSYPQGAMDKYVLDAVSKWTFTPPKNGYGESLRLNHQIHAFSLDKVVTATQKYKKDNAEYIAAIKDAADAGFAEYQYKYALLAHAGILKSEKALPWYLKSAVSGYALAQVSIAQCLFSGSLCDIDNNKGMNWLAKAADSGHAPSSFTLAQKLLNSDNIQFDPLRAAKYLKQASAKGYAPAIVEYSALLANSSLPEIRNPELAIQIAEQGLKKDDENPNLLASIATAKFELGKLDEARELLAEAIEHAESRGMDTTPFNELLESYQSDVQTAAEE